MDAKRIREVVDSDAYVGGMLDMSGGHIHPLNLALGEAAAVETLAACRTFLWFSAMIAACPQRDPA